MDNSPITVLTAEDEDMVVVDSACENLAEHDTKHPASDDSDTI